MVDFNIKTTSPTINDDAELVIQQIDILFDTDKDTVFGEENFGTNYARLLYDLQLSNEAIETQVMSDLRSINLLGFEPEVNVLLLQGTERDIMLIDIFLRRDNREYNKTYKIA